MAAENEKNRKFNQIKAAGWYLEWNVNTEYLLVIKSTSQEDTKLTEQTERIKKQLQESSVNQSAFDFKSYTIDHPTEWELITSKYNNKRFEKLIRNTLVSHAVISALGAYK